MEKGLVLFDTSSFWAFKALNQQLAQKVYKCVNSWQPTKRSTENIEEGEQRIIAEINPRN
jgi:hypothetical protein